MLDVMSWWKVVVGAAVVVIVEAACGGILTVSDDDNDDSSSSNNNSSSPNTGQEGDGSTTNGPTVQNDGASMESAPDAPPTTLPPPSPSVTCGSKECMTGEACCVGEGNGELACAASCSPDSAAVLQCDEPADCETGMRCRLVRAIVTIAQCVSPGLAGPDLCRSNADCGGDPCVPVLCANTTVRTCNGACGG